jgi:glycosyltransferase involved in cell wall biosynthesis
MNLGINSHSEEKSDPGDRGTIWIINQYATTPGTGIGGRHYYLAQELATQGYNVSVIAASYTHLMRKSPEVKSRISIERIDQIEYIWIKVAPYLQAHSAKRVFNWFAFAWHLRKLTAKRFRSPDFILYSSPSLIGFLSARWLSRRLNAHLAFEVRDIWPLTLIEVGGYSSKHPFIRFLQWVEDTAYRDAKVVISNLGNAVEHMKNRGMNPEKFTWIPNGFSLRELSQAQPLHEEICRKLPVETFIVGYTGTLGSANAVNSLVEAAAILRDKTDISFVLVGTGKEKQRLQQLVKDKQLKNVVFLDPIPKIQIQSMLSNFDVCYIGLTADPLFRFGVSPNKLFDYLYAGKPILYAVDSGESLVDRAQAGLSIEPESPRAIADAVLKLYAMPPANRAKLGQNGRRYVLANHEYSMLAKKLVSTLENVTLLSNRSSQ